MHPWPYKPNQSIRLKIDALHPSGEGEGSLEGVRVLVRGALPGEEITAKVASISRHRPEAIGALLSVDVASPDRVIAPCPHVERCGGCDWQHLSYPAQRRAKQYNVQRQLAHYPALRQVKVEECQPSDDVFGYRYVAKWVPQL